MRGGFVHNVVLLDPVETHFRGCQAEVRREFPTQPGRAAGFIDLVAKLDRWTIAVEAELTARRVCWDVHKARAIGAQVLLIVVPTRKVARAARTQLRAAGLLDGDFVVWILPLGAALQRLRSCFPLFSGANVA